MYIKQYQNNDGIYHVEVEQPSVVETWAIDGEEADHYDSIFGHIKDTSRWIKAGDLKDGDLGEAFLKRGWLDDELIEIRSESPKNGWTRLMIWGFQHFKVDGVEKRMYARRSVLTRGPKVMHVEFVYDFCGRLER